MTCPLRWALIALNFVMNCPGLTPLAPSAGPIGGAGVALPPGAWSLNWLVISFLAIVVYPLIRRTFPSRSNPGNKPPQQARPCGGVANPPDRSTVDDRHVDFLTAGAGHVVSRRGEPKDVGESGRLLLYLLLFRHRRSEDRFEDPVQRHGQQ